MEPIFLNQVLFIILGIGITTILIANSMKKKTKEDSSSTHVEQLLNQFMEEMESDNERLMTKLKLQKELLEDQLSLRDKKIELLSSHISEIQKQLNQLISSTRPKKELEQIKSSIADRYPELFALLADGGTIEEIAKKTGMGKGEVLLIIQLSKEEGEQR